MTIAKTIMMVMIIHFYTIFTMTQHSKTDVETSFFFFTVRHILAKKKPTSVCASSNSSSVRRGGVSPI